LLEEKQDKDKNGRRKKDAQSKGREGKDVEVKNEGLPLC
jgi:hypothetical protein